MEDDCILNPKRELAHINQIRPHVHLQYNTQLIQWNWLPKCSRVFVKACVEHNEKHTPFYIVDRLINYSWENKKWSTKLKYNVSTGISLNCIVH